MTFLYKINGNDEIIDYIDDILPNRITSIDYLEFEIEDYIFQLHDQDLIGLNYLQNNDTEGYHQLLYAFSEILEDIKCLTLKDLYENLEDIECIDLCEWHPFYEETFSMLFSNFIEAARATYFGNINEWTDNYIRLNAYGNLESCDELPFDEYANEIINQYFSENFDKYLTDTVQNWTYEN